MGKPMGMILLLALAAVVRASQPPPTPLRLQVSAQPGTLRQGERTRIAVQFLSREYQPVANDANRTVQFKWQPLDRAASGNMPPSAPVPPGVWHFETWFECRTPGRFMISVSSAGLDPAQTFVVGVRPTSRLNDWFIPRVYAASKPTVQILPREFQAFPANDLTPARLTLVLDRPAGKNLSVSIRASKDVSIIYRDRVSHNVMTIPIAEGSQNSEDIQIKASRPADVDVTACISPCDKSDSVKLRFNAPTPAKIYLEPSNLSFTGGRKALTAEVGVADQDKVPIKALIAEHPIGFSATNDHKHAFLAIDPATVRLKPENPKRQVALRMIGYPPGGQLQLQAKDDDEDLDSFVTTLLVDKPARTLVLILLAIFGGILGALAKQFFWEEVRFVWPRWLNGTLRLGLVGDTCFGGLFGTIAFLAFELGLFRHIPLWSSVPDSLSSATAFLLGFVGGYGGPILLDRLLEIPKRVRATQPAA